MDDTAPLDLTPPFALLRREGHARVELLRGDVTSVARLADLPEAQQLALVPYRQLRERGDACHDDGTPLLTLLVRERAEIAVEQLPEVAPPQIRDGDFDVCDDAYALQVKAVLEEEIGRGEGANFVLRRSFVGYCDDVTATALGAFRRLLAQERGAYWTFLVHTGDLVMVGATPERHVSVHEGVAVMNPISGTLRMPPAQATAEQVLGFLGDPKERDELAMVVDEELKMLAEVGGHGRVTGPFLKEMRNLAHTEYYIRARTEMDVRQVLRATMFAPTATGSPIRNAFRVIQRHETGGRGHYGGVAALIGTDAQGRQSMDASLLLRVAYLNPADGSVRIPVGATLVRGSDPYEEVRETRSKAAGVLRAFGVDANAGGMSGAGSQGRGGKDAGPLPAAETAPEEGARTAPGAAGRTAIGEENDGLRQWADDPRVLTTLAARNDVLAPFWLQEHRSGAFVVPELRGRSVLIVDNEDAFTSMLAVQLRALGLEVTRASFAAVDGSAGYEQRDGLDGFDLVLLGPGPGDPRDLSLPKVRVGRVLIQRLFARRQPVLGVCLGHQLLCTALNFELIRRPEPNQGTQIEVDLFGRRELVGFYNSFSALAPEFAVPGLEVATLPGSREIVAMRGPGYGGVQFHAESVFSKDGLGILRREITRLLVERSV